MKQHRIAPLSRLLALALLAAACGDDKPPIAPDGSAYDVSVDSAASSDGLAPDAGQPAGDLGPPIVLAARQNLVQGHFATSALCQTCHANSASAQAMRDEQAREVGMVDLWRATMMANAARDPFWRAVVSAEVAKTPAAKAVIESKCMRCHAPMAHEELKKMGAEDVPLATVYAGSTPSGQLALDGVSCPLCHQVDPANLGTDDSYGGGFVIGDEKLIYGPHDDFFSSPMVGFPGNFTPVPGAHMRDPGHCASCHTLHTSTVDANGVATGHVLPEQTPYFEWRSSAYSTEAASPGPLAMTCQGCHVPQQSVDGVAISTQVSTTPNGIDFPKANVPDRSPYGRHVYVGGNTLVPQILDAQRAHLEPHADSAAFAASTAAAREQLEKASAAVAIVQAALADQTLGFEVQVESYAGHKLPTGFPSRRAWLHVTVRDSAQQVIFESGAVDAAGRLLGGGEVLESERVGGPIEPHHTMIDDDAKVQIYESVMADPDGKATITLLRGATYLKDNRLLPRGWQGNAPDAAEAQPVGVGSDSDFSGGGDAVRYAVPLGAASGPFTIDVALRYQTLSARWAAELFVTDTPEVRWFQSYTSQADRRGEVLATASQQVAP